MPQGFTQHGDVLPGTQFVADARQSIEPIVHRKAASVGLQVCEQSIRSIPSIVEFSAAFALQLEARNQLDFTAQNALGAAEELLHP